MSVASVVRRLATSAAMVAVAATAAQAQTPTDMGFFGNGGNVSVKYVFSDAGHNSQLLYKIGAFSSNIGDYTLLFTNNSPASAIGSEADLGTVSAGTEVVFMLNNLTTGQQFFTGSYGRNPLGEAHVSLLTTAPYEPSGDESSFGGFYDIRFGFEDVTPLSDSDEDYNDIQFEIANVTSSVVPEPSTYALMGAGLLALGVAARRRKV
ncbi:MAG: PEP-CTERM sorting domain-containing protein [Gemmatimonas sp.]